MIVGSKRLVSILACVSISGSGIACRQHTVAEAEIVEQSENLSLLIAIEVSVTEDHIFSKGDTIPLEVTLRNLTSDDVHVCWEGRDFLKGMWEGRFRIAGHEYIGEDGLHRDHRLHASEDLAVLRPGTSRTRSVTIPTQGLPNSGTCAAMELVLQYYCPFSAGELDGAATIVAEGVLDSNEQRVKIDSRGWWGRILGRTCE